MNSDYDHLLPIRSWTLWYSDGSTCSSEDGTWSQAPDEDVQIQCIYHDAPYRTFFVGQDTYHLPGRKTAKRGRWMDADGFAALMRRAEEG